MIQTGKFISGLKRKSWPIIRVSLADGRRKISRRGGVNVDAEISRRAPTIFIILDFYVHIPAAVMIGGVLFAVE